MTKKIWIFLSILVGILILSILTQFVMYYNGAFTELTPQKTAEELVATVIIYRNDLEEPYMTRAVIVDKDKIVTGLYDDCEKVTYFDKENDCEIPLVEVKRKDSLGLKLFKTENGEILNEDIWEYLSVSVQYNNAIPYQVAYRKYGEINMERAYMLNVNRFSKDKEALAYIKINNPKIYAPVIDRYGRFAGITVQGNENTMIVILPYYVFKLLY